MEPNSVSSGDGRPPQPRAHWRALEGMYLAAPVNAYYQPSIEIASQSIEQEAFVLTTRFELELLVPVTRGVLEAHGEVVERGERIEATATLELGGRPVASGRGTFARGGTLLAEVPAYQLSEQLLA